MRKITFTLFALAIAGTLVFATVPKQWQQQLSDELDQLLQQLKNYNEQRPEDRVYVHFDKTLYKPGETIWFSVYLRDGVSLKASDESDMINVQLINPKGGVVTSYKVVAKDGIAKGDFRLSDNAVGGIYTVKAFTNWMLNEHEPAIFTKEITVQKVIMPRLKMELDFEKEAYGAADKVTAELKLNDNTNKALKNHKFEYVVNLGGDKFITKTGTTGENGKAIVDFELPENLETNDGLVNIQIKYQGQTESISKKVPIVLNKIHVSLFPEGGDLVNGLTSKVAFKAVNEFGKAADIEGELVNSQGEKITSFSSYHFGIGAFALTPKANEKYTIKITKPTGINQTYEVPEALDAGYVLEVRDISKNQVSLTVHSTQTEKLFLVGNVRGQKYFSTNIQARKGENRMTVPTKFFPIGVAHFTLFDSKGIERAERLAFVNKDKQLKIKIKTNKEKYLPREKVKMTIKVSDENGKAVPANLSLSVVDDQLLTYTDDKSSNILSWMLMEADLKGTVQEPNFYFDKKEEKADQALDYLLMTSGWRRFTWKEIRDGTLPNNTRYKSERAEIGGTVRDSKTRETLEGVKVRFGDWETYTDEGGNFSFRGFTLDGRTNLHFSKDNYFERTMPVYSYSKKFNPSLKPHLKREKPQIAPPTPKDEIEFEGDRQVPKTTIPALPTSPKQTTNQEIDFNDDELLDLDDDAEEESPIYEEEEEEEFEGRKRVIKPNVLIPPTTPKTLTEKEITREIPNQEVESDEEEIPVPDDTEAEEPIFYEEEEEKESEIDFDPIFTIVETMPIFPGCEGFDTKEEQTSCTEKSLLKYIYQNIKYPMIARDNGIEGLVVAQFVIEKDGSIGETRVLRDIGAGCGDELLRVINSMNAMHPSWIPGMQRNRFVAVRYNVPMRFKLSESPSTLAKNIKVETKPLPNYRRPQRKFSLPKRYYRGREFAAPIYDRDEPVRKRTDFRSTIYWNGNVEIGKSGQATLEFYTSDAVTSFRITAEGISTNGSVGRVEQRFYTQLPFSLSAKLPTQVVTEDVLKVPLTLVNNANKPIGGNLSYTIPLGLKATSTLQNQVFLDKKEAKTIYLDFDVIEKSDADDLEIQFQSEGLSDAISKKLKIISKGFPTSLSIVGETSNQTHSFKLKDAIKGSITGQITAYPSAISNLLGGVEGMLRQPYGCFEQTSSSTYPNVIALKYMKATNQVNPDFVKKGKQYVESGYKRLLNYRTPEGGFSWYGRNPSHAGLTAYGLMQFIEMQQVADCIDQEVIDQMTTLLMSRRDGTGQFELHSNYARTLNQKTVSLYITWALTEAGFTDLNTEVNFAYEQAKASKHPYELALAANALLNISQDEKAQELIDMLVELQNASGSFDLAKDSHSAVGSRGYAHQIESVALAISAMLKSKQPKEMAIRNGINYLKSKRSSNGRFGPSQSTMLALRAMIEYIKYFNIKNQEGTIEVYVNGNKMATTSYTQGQEDPVKIKGLEQYLTLEKNKVEVIFSDTKHPLPYVIGINYNTALPKSSKKCFVDLTTQLSTTQTKVGETVRLTAHFKNKNEVYYSTPMVIIGLPAGLTPQPWQLKELQEQGKFDYYEIRDNELLLYYRHIKPSEAKTIHFDLKAELAGTFDAPPSRAYLYYYDEHKVWTALDRIEILAN